MSFIPDVDEQRLRVGFAASVSLYALVLVLSSQLPLFDESPLLVRNTWFRWDLLHFGHIAEHGYTYENQWAFLPTLPLFIRLSSNIVGVVTDEPVALQVFTAVVITLLAFESVRTLYKLSLHHLKSHHLALLASSLALLPSSPVTFFFVPYNEAFFTFFSYKGMHACSKQQWTKAAFLFAAATSFRSNGILLAGFILWGLLLQPFITAQKIHPTTLLKATILTAIVLLPFISYQAFAYTIFCSEYPSSTTTTPRAEWCSNFPPSIYTHVQSKYWNVGFMRYWTISQIPNFIIAAPPLVLILTYGYKHVQSVWRMFGSEGVSVLRQQDPKANPSPPYIEALSIAPHAIHAVLFSFILLFASHTQIALRLVASMPFTYWAAAWLYVEHPRLGAMWVTWSLMWGLTSTILWATFLPPA